MPCRSGYSIDGCRGVRDPRGMFGQRLGVELHLVSAPRGAAAQPQRRIERCHLEVQAVVAILCRGARLPGRGRAHARRVALIAAAASPGSPASPMAASRTSTPCRSAAVTSPAIWPSGCRPAGRRPSASRRSSAACCRRFGDAPASVEVSWPATPGDRSARLSRARLAESCARGSRRSCKWCARVSQESSLDKMARPPRRADRRRQPGSGRVELAEDVSRQTGPHRPSPADRRPARISRTDRRLDLPRGCCVGPTSTIGGLTFWSLRPNRIGPFGWQRSANGSGKIFEHRAIKGRATEGPVPGSGPQRRRMCHNDNQPKYARDP